MIPRNTTPPKSRNHLIYDNAAVGHQLAMERNDMLVPGKFTCCWFFVVVQPDFSSLDVSRVLIIYTGGTIGMKHTPEHGYVPVSFFFFLIFEMG